ncbi:MAG TPA: response regulator [Anaerolineae bacterium]|nr:response regulator [Anaerolineae bacterium]
MPARILIVDDEKQLAQALRSALLMEIPDCTVDLAHSGEEALSRLAGATYNLILADLRMPGVGGMELIRGVRYLDAQVPVVLMTGYGSPQLLEEARLLGVHSYLDKPFDVAQIAGLLRQALPEGAQQDG